MMGSRINHDRARSRSRMAQHGSEDVQGGGGHMVLTPPPRFRKSKADQRAENAAAMEGATHRVTCQACGHSADVVLPPAKIGRRLKCSKCGSVCMLGVR